MYERVNETIGQIDQKHYEYTKASASKILYLNAADKSIKGHLDFIFKTYAETLSKGESVAPILNGINQTITFAQHGYVTPDSLTLPIIRQLRGESIPMSLTDFDDVRDMLMQGFLDETSNQFSNDAIFDFMDFAFGDESEVHISDIPLPSFDAFLLLILATIKTNDEECFYIVETDPGNVSSHGYRLPNLRFVRKELTL
ncbi:MAG: Wadjet anti-phage system protein JetA family protein [Bacilli bacterium]